MTSLHGRSEFFVDAVYLYVNGERSEHKKARCEYGVDEYRGPKSAIRNSRWRDNGELVQSIISLQKYIPWINKIFIITSCNQQIPTELLASVVCQKNIQKVDDVVVREALIESSTFSHRAIECCVYNVPNLSEHFLYICDDMFFGATLNRGHFFTKDGRPRVFVNGLLPYDKNALYSASSTTTNFQHIEILKAKCHDLLSTCYPKDHFYDILHQPVALTKSLMQKCWSMTSLATEFSITKNSKFLSRRDVLPLIIVQNVGLLEHLATKSAILNQEYFIHEKSDLSWIKDHLHQTRPPLYCINDISSNGASQTWIETYQQFLMKSLVHCMDTSVDTSVDTSSLSDIKTVAIEKVGPSIPKPLTKSDGHLLLFPNPKSTELPELTESCATLGPLRSVGGPPVARAAITKPRGPRTVPLRARRLTWTGTDG